MSHLSDNLAVNFSTLYSPINADMHAVDQVIRTRLHSDVVLIRQVAEYIISAGGKRMRRVGIVALARRLAIALWRYLQTGEIPAGATLKPVASREDGSRRPHGVLGPACEIVACIGNVEPGISGDHREALGSHITSRISDWAPHLRRTIAEPNA